MRQNMRSARRETRADKAAAAGELLAAEREYLEPALTPDRGWDQAAPGELDEDPRRDETDNELEEGNATAADKEDKETNESQGPDDALGLYLRQMGSIPLLNRQQELSLAQRLERARRRYRRAALANWR